MLGVSQGNMFHVKHFSDFFVKYVSRETLIFEKTLIFGKSVSQGNMFHVKHFSVKRVKHFIL